MVSDFMKASLWARIEKLMDTLHTNCIQLWQLERVLGKIRDPNSHVSLLENLIKPGESTFVQSFWKMLCTSLQQGFEKAAKSSAFIEGVFSGEFPKLYRYFQDFFKRLQTHYEMKQLAMT